MNKFWIILSHTYMSRVKTKAFLISTVIILLFMVGMGNIQSIISFFSNDELDKIAVIDESNELSVLLTSGAENTNSNFELVLYEGSEAEAKKAVQKEEYQALLTLSLDLDHLPEAGYYANNITETGMQMEIEQQLQQLKVAMATELAGIDQATLIDINAPVSFNTVALDESAKTSEELSQAQQPGVQPLWHVRA